MGSRLVLSLIAASLSILATAGEAGSDAVRLIRGPWWWHGPDGAIQLAVAVAGHPALPASLEVDGRAVAVTASATDLADDRDGAGQVVVVRLPPETRGAVRWRLGAALARATVAPPPPRDATARIVLAGGGCWPDRAVLATMARHLGGPPGLVLALGEDCARRLGSGGWEGDVPVAVIAPADPLLDTCTGGMAARWRHGVGHGVLGLPASPDRNRADLALARDLSPWLVYCDVPAAWDPAISRPSGDPGAAGVLIADCQRLSVPLILAAARSGLVSEPLRLAPGGAMVHSAGGVRVALAVPIAEDGLSGLPAEVALPLEQPLAAGLVADAGHLAMVFARPGAADAIRLAWTRGDDASPALGNGDQAALMKRLEASEDLVAAAPLIEALLWLPRPALAQAVFKPELLQRLRDEGGAAGRALVRRMAVVYADAPDAPAIPGDPDPLAIRDVLLWRIARIHGREALGWRDAAAASADPVVLRALLAELARDSERDAMPALVRRLELQAAGEMPLDPDPIDQHRLFAAVFDSVDQSPTGLRPLAVALRDKASALARGPIDRFIARHGAERPVP